MTTTPNPTDAPALALTWPRKCGCGESWTKEQWAELPSDGRYSAGAEGWLELRLCVCGARLTIPCDPPEPATPPPATPAK